jgi:hypothetical protein
MNADCAHLSEQSGLLDCSTVKRQKVARGYTPQKGPEDPNVSVYPHVSLPRRTFSKKKAAGKKPRLTAYFFLVEMKGFERWLIL